MQSTEPIPLTSIIDTMMEVSRVRYSARGGWQSEKDRADLVLVRDRVYTLRSFVIEPWSSAIQLEEVDGWFNMCMFDIAD